MEDKRKTFLAKEIWDYCNFRSPLVPADAILVLCSHDIRIASYAAELYLEGWAPLLIFSGGLSPYTSKIYRHSEAEAFAEIARANGIPESSLLLETKSTNTQENLEFSFSLLNRLGKNPSRVILVQKPNMLRRVYATATRLFPEIHFYVTSHQIEFEDAPHAHLSREILIHEIVGDLQRIRLYAERGMITPQEIAPQAWRAMQELIDQGYTLNLIK